MSATKEFSNEVPTITTFLELMDEITWAWHDKYPPYITDSEKWIVIDKLTIGPDFASYKTSNWKLAPGVYEKALEFVKLLQEA